MAPRATKVVMKDVMPVPKKLCVVQSPRVGAFPK